MFTMFTFNAGHLARARHERDRLLREGKPLAASHIKVGMGRGSVLLSSFEDALVQATRDSDRTCHCGKVCKSRRGLSIHQRTHAKAA